MLKRPGSTITARPDPVHLEMFNSAARRLLRPRTCDRRVTLPAGLEIRTGHSRTEIRWGCDKEEPEWLSHLDLTNAFLRYMARRAPLGSYCLFNVFRVRMGPLLQRKRSSCWCRARTSNRADTPFGASRARKPNRTVPIGVERVRGSPRIPHTTVRPAEPGSAERAGGAPALLRVHRSAARSAWAWSP